MTEMFAAYLRRSFPGIQKWVYNYSGFNKYGLRREDIIHETPDVIEALRRIQLRSPEVIEERNFRIVRAMQLDCAKKYLPKEQWTKLEEDDLYLLPVLREVIKERKERQEWEAQ
ncbi:cytochrome b-c1 complex subunit 7-like [Ceratina calcarata]|uniref:Cytochrome b-c1 complex subunit 7 n=1 Tax=Ceratina calcarata TaxID=156304 RepID=A0AAJ7N8J2_9HYME|nr:cytochrome b-c1 complex subunit 7-like [Ceratina calcarata]